MFILWGTKQTQDQLATGNEYICPRCNNMRRWPVLQYTTWFTIFFIPLIPLRKKYYEMCPICRAGRELTKKQAEAWKNK